MAIKLDRSNTAEQASTPRGVQFLSPKHTTSAGKLAKITKVSTPDNGGKPDNFGNPYIVWLTMDGQKYSKGFKPTSDNLAMLVDILGDDEAKWVGQQVVVGKSSDDESGERLVFTKPNAGSASKKK